MLEGKLVNLKVLEREDLRLVAEWSNNPEFSGEYEPLEQISLREVEKWYDNLHSEENWFTIEKKDGNKIGQIFHSPRGQHVVIGYKLVPGERNKGYGTEAVEIMVDYLFLSKNIVRIQADTNPRNIASQRVLEKAGFKREGLVADPFSSKGNGKTVFYSAFLEMNGRSLRY